MYGFWEIAFGHHCGAELYKARDEHWFSDVYVYRQLKVTWQTIWFLKIDENALLCFRPWCRSFATPFVNPVWARKGVCSGSCFFLGVEGADGGEGNPQKQKPCPCTSLPSTLSLFERVPSPFPFRVAWAPPFQFTVFCLPFLLVPSVLVCMGCITKTWSVSRYHLSIHFR